MAEVQFKVSLKGNESKDVFLPLGLLKETEICSIKMSDDETQTGPGSFL